MNTRATMEGERDMEMAATLLLKPDSVLAYSCFYDDVANLSVAARQMLSANEGARIFNIPVWAFSPGDMFQPGSYLYQHYLNVHPYDPSKGYRFPPGGVPFRDDTTPLPIAGTSPQRLEEWKVPGTPYQQYNPNHPLTSPNGPRPNLAYDEGIWDYSFPPDNISNPYPFPGAGHFNNSLSIMIVDSLFRHLTSNFDHTFLGGTGALNRNCYLMRQVWDAARCDNFDREHFYSFRDLTGSDPRQLPEACSTGFDWSSAITLTDLEPGKLGAMKTLVTYLRHMNYNLDPPPKCDKDSLIIETGVTVLTGMAKGADGSAMTSVAEKICSLPGCYYDPKAEKCQ